MRILPDLHFRENYKKRYTENYEKISTKLEEQAEVRRNRVPDSPDVVRYKIAGFVSSVIIIGCFFAVGFSLSVKSAEKERRIAELENQIIEADNLVKTYQIVNGEAMKEQLDEAVVIVTDLQNQYVTQTFSEDFEQYADRYLGDFNNNWASDLELSNPRWQGYVNRAHEFDDTACFIFILYDDRTPILVTDVRYELDGNGNLGIMKSVRKMRLS